MYTGIRLLLLLIHLIISSFFFLSNFQRWNIWSHFPRELWGLEDWNLVHVDIGQMYHVYRNQAAAAYLSLYFFIFLSLQFLTEKFFVTLFSGTVRPRRLKIGIHVDSGQMYHVYQNQAAAAYSSHYFFIFLSNFQHWNFLSHFSWELWGLEDWNLVHTWTVGSCIMYTRIRLLLLIHPFISSFFSLSNFQHWNFSSLFSQELWGLEDWKLVHTWTVGRYIMYIRIRLLLLIHLIISNKSSFFFLSNFQHWNFLSHFSRELWGLEDWNLVHTWTMGRCTMYTGIRLLLLIHLIISSFFFLSNFQHWNFSSLFSGTMRLEDWKLVHKWTVGRCIMYTRIRLLLLIHPFISSFFFLSNFQHWNF